MKIIQLIYSLSSGGAERFVVSLSNQLAEMGHDVIICTMRPDESLSSFYKPYVSDSVRFKSLLLNSGFSFEKMRVVEDYILSEKPDVVHCHLNVIPFLYRLIIKKLGIKFYHTVHSVAKVAAGLSVQYPIDKYLYKKKLLIPVTITHECLDTFLKYYKLNDVKCIYNGCEQLRPSESYETVVAEVNAYKFSSNTKVFIHVARCNPIKNQELLVDAFNQMYAEGYDCILLVLGNGFDTTELGRLLKMKSSPNIHYLGLKNNVCDYMLQADAFCMTSIQEGLPISLLEAMSCGVVPICTAVGGIPDVIVDGETGFLSDLSLESYKSKIIEYLNSDIDKSYLIQNYKAKYSMEKCAEEYLEVYTEKQVL